MFWQVNHGNTPMRGMWMCLPSIMHPAWITLWFLKTSWFPSRWLPQLLYPFRTQSAALFVPKHSVKLVDRAASVLLRRRNYLRVIKLGLVVFEDQLVPFPMVLETYRMRKISLERAANEILASPAYDHILVSFKQVNGISPKVDRGISFPLIMVNQYHHITDANRDKAKQSVGFTVIWKSQPKLS